MPLLDVAALVGKRKGRTPGDNACEFLGVCLSMHVHLDGRAWWAFFVANASQVVGVGKGVTLESRCCHSTMQGMH
jgi:hypothetical protein